LTNHGAKMIGHPRAVWGVTNGNPVWEEMLEAARMVQPSFLLNVALNSDRQITGVFAGDMEAAHQRGREFVKDSAMVAVDKLFDVVITSNSGYPLDQNLYQAVKGMSAAARVVAEGGTIIVAAECCDGIPDHGQYAQLLRESASPDELLARIESPGFGCHDQWQVQIQAKIQQRATVYIYADGLTDEQIIDAHLRPCRNIEGTLRQLIDEAGRPLSVCVLPEGPVTIPYLIDAAT
jgi:nickel-dependent lactate racemase